MEKKFALLFKALSDENRLIILRRLIEGETCGCTLIDKMTISQPTLSYHLNILNEVGLTTVCKEGVWKKHHVDIKVIDQLIEYLLSLKKNDSGCNSSD